MGAELDARAMSHLELVSDAAIQARIPLTEKALSTLLPQLSKKERNGNVRPFGKSRKRGQLVESVAKVNGCEKDSCGGFTDDRIHPETRPSAS